MEGYKDIKIINEENYHLYEDDIVRFCSSSLSKGTYAESLKDDEINRRLQEYFRYKDGIILIKMDASETSKMPVALCAGYNAFCSSESLRDIKASIPLKESFLIADLLFDDGPCGKGEAGDLITYLIHTKSDVYKCFLARAGDKHDPAISLFEEAFSFKRLDNKNIRPIFGLTSKSNTLFYLDIEVKKIHYLDLSKINVEETGEELVDVNCYDKGILTERGVSIVQFPYFNEAGEIKVRRCVAEKLGMVNQRLRELSDKWNNEYRLNVCFGFWNNDIQKKAFFCMIKKFAGKKMPFNNIYKFVEEVHRYIAVPTVAGHPTGGAVAVTIKDLKNNRFLDMGSRIYEFFSDKVGWDAKGLTLEQKINRQLIFNLMGSVGFAPFYGEWWHYSYGDREWAAYYQKQTAIYDQLAF